MDECVDDVGDALFTDDYEHAVTVYTDLSGNRNVDFIKTNGNLWLSASAVIEMVGLNAKDTKHTGRLLARLDHPDIIKIKDTPFRFTDGRRNRGSLVSPRAVKVLADGKTGDFNPIMATNFVDWLNEHLLAGQDMDHWSPAKRKIERTEPVFRKVTHEKPHDHPELDPLRPVGRYLPLTNVPPLQVDEVEFCLCCDERTGLGKCWCRGKGGIKTYTQQQVELCDHHDSVIDEDDVFELTTQIVTTTRIKTVSVPMTLTTA
ncbi:hypothetical protein MED193_08248 [Roseobacter sp. MED193]|uniref:hypothetical protein n=1 Tax=Roseobacter sp. MED193 TaxID=314262 RepID=UPI000068E087|nr:hypothetical protein [Roseobacter sp. MED193]EAQ45629.1 hypothetical protein MED193_08248 [Roseobacter sp. MED193]